MSLILLNAGDTARFRSVQSQEQNQTVTINVRPQPPGPPSSRCRRNTEHISNGGEVAVAAGTLARPGFIELACLRHSIVLQ